MASPSYLAKRFLCLACVAVVVAITSLPSTFTNHRRKTSRSTLLKTASEPLVFPAFYNAWRPVGLNFYKDMVYESNTGQEIGYARMCAQAFSYQTLQILNAQDEIALAIKREVVKFTDQYTVEEQWRNATRFYIEYPWGHPWGGYAHTREEVERSSFQLFPKWKVRRLQNGTEFPLPGYIFAALPTITTMREIEDEDDMEGD